MGRLVTKGDESAVEPVIDGNGSAISAGVKKYIDVPFHCYLDKIVLEADQAGDIVIDIWKCTYDDFDAGSNHPVDADSITASSQPTISSDDKYEDGDLTGWTREFAKGDCLAINVDSCTTITRITISLRLTKT